MKFIFIVVFIFCATLLVFSMQNTADVYITFLKWGISTTLTISVLAAFTGGVITGMLMLLPRLIRKNSMLRSLEKKQSSAQTQNEVYVDK